MSEETPKQESANMEPAELIKAFMELTTSMQQALKRLEQLHQKQFEQMDALEKRVKALEEQ